MCFNWIGGFFLWRAIFFTTLVGKKLFSCTGIKDELEKLNKRIA